MVTEVISREGGKAMNSRLLISFASLSFAAGACGSSASNGRDRGHDRRRAARRASDAVRTGAAGAPSGNQSVLERNKNPSRDGHFVQPALTKAAAATMSRNTGFAASFAGNMWASPLYIENGPGGTGAFFAVTTGNDVFALDETTGAVKWMRNIGSSPTRTAARAAAASTRSASSARP